MQLVPLNLSPFSEVTGLQASGPWRLIHLIRKDCYIHIGLGRAQLCAIPGVMTCLSAQGDAPGPLFLVKSGQPLTSPILADWLRQVTASSGIEGNLSSNSFRIGAANVAPRNSIPDHEIQALGQWTNNVYQHYIRTPTDPLASLSQPLTWEVYLYLEFVNLLCYPPLTVVDVRGLPVLGVCELALRYPKRLSELVRSHNDFSSLEKTT